MDYSKLPRINLSGILLAVAIGILVAVVLYQAQVRGLIPVDLPSPKLPNLQTQTVVKEENAVINVVQNSSPSVVAIGISRRVVNPFDPFSSPTREDSTIGTGFLVSDKG